MAYGLRRIVNATYQPYGTGRDWFFLGDYEYTNGKRTPGPQEQWKAKIDKIPSRPAGRPQEMRRARSAAAVSSSSRAPPAPKSACGVPQACPGSEHIERWRRLSTEPRSSAVAASGFLSSADAALLKAQRRSPSAPTCGHIAAGAAAATFQTTGSDYGSLQSFNATGILAGDKYSRFSERVCLPEHVAPSGSERRFVTATESSAYGTHQGFDASKLGSKYGRFSTPVHPPGSL